MKGSEVLEKVLSGNKRFVQGERTGVWYTMSRILERSSVIADAVLKGELLLKGAVYALTTSQVTFRKEEG